MSKANSASHDDITYRVSKALTPEIQHRASVLLLFRRVRFHVQILYLELWATPMAVVSEDVGHVRRCLSFPRHSFETPWSTSVRGLSDLMGSSLSKESRRAISTSISVNAFDSEKGITYICVDGDSLAETCPIFADIEKYNFTEGLRLQQQLVFEKFSFDTGLPKQLSNYIHNQRFTKFE